MFTLLPRLTLPFRALPIRAALILSLCLLTVSASATVSAQQADRTVTGLTLSSDEPGELAIRWNAATPEPVDYRVSWARSEDEYLTWTDDSGNAFPTTNSLTLTDLDEGVEYKVQVRARYGGDGSGPWSDEVRLTVTAEPQGDTPEPGGDGPNPSGGTGEVDTGGGPTEDGATAEREVVGLTLISDDPGVLAVTWNAASPEPVDYRVNWARSEDDYPTWTDDIGNAFPATNSLTITALDEGVEYKVQVRARYGGAGSGPWSDEVRLTVAAGPGGETDEATPPASPPTGLQVTAVAHDAVTLNWDDPQDDTITGYRVLRRSLDRHRHMDGLGASELAIIVDDTGSSATSFTDDTVSPRTRYLYRIRAISAASPGPSYADLKVETHTTPATVLMGEMTVGESSPEHDREGRTAIGFSAIYPVGELTPERFYLDGTSSGVYGLFYFQGDSLPDLHLGLSNPPFAQPFVLKVGDRQLASSEAAIRKIPDSLSVYTWSRQCVGWQEGDKVPVGLRLTTPDDPLLGQSLNDASLKDLTLSGVELTPDFSPDVENYTASVGYSDDKIAVSATANHAAACGVEISPQPDDEGRLTLVEGENTISVKVTGADGETTRTHTVLVDRVNDSITDGAGLSRLSLSGVSGFKLAPRRTRYDVEVGPQVRLTTVDLEGSEEGTVTAVEAVRSGQTLTLDKEDADPEAPGDQVRLPTHGDTLVFVRAESEDDTRERVYTLLLRPEGEAAANRNPVAIKSARGAGSSLGTGSAQSDPTPRSTQSSPSLSALGIEGVSLSPAFAAGAFEYTASVAYDVARVTVVANLQNGGSLLISPDDDDEADGYQVRLKAVQPGGEPVQTVITVVLNSADGMQLQSYSITVNRAAPPAYYGFKKVDTGWFSHSCALRTDGTVVCWGSRDAVGGSLNGNNDGIHKDVVAGNRTACGVREDGSAYCWATLRSRWGPYAGDTLAREAEKFITFSQSGHCWLDAEGIMRCNNGTAAPSGTFQSIAVGYQLSCGLDTDGRARCWNSDEELDTPEDTFKFLAAGGHRACGIKMDDRLLCWQYLFPGHNPTNPYSIDRGVFGGAVKHVDTGYKGMTCVVKMDGEAACTGHRGIFGPPRLPNYHPPEGPFLTVSVDHDTSACGLKTDRSIVCWGDAGGGALNPPSIVTPWSGNAQLLGIELEGVELDSDFDRDTLTYTASVDNSVSATAVSVRKTNRFADVVISPGDADSAAEGDQVNLNVGTNPITLTVTSADGQATGTYTITVTREAS